MGKKKNASASASASASEVPESSRSSKVIENLEILNNHLMEQVVDLQKQIEDLEFELLSFAEDRDIVHSIERDVFGLVLSSSIEEAAAVSAANMAAATEMAESAAGELNEAEMRLQDLVREKDAAQKDLERVLEERDSSLRSLEKAELEKTKEKKKWIYPIAAAAAILLTSAAIITFWW